MTFSEDTQVLVFVAFYGISGMAFGVHWHWHCRSHGSGYSTLWVELWHACCGGVHRLPSLCTLHFEHN